MIRPFAFLLLTIFSVFQAAAITFDEVQQRLVKHSLIRAEFEQTKHISGMNQPLKSGGNVIISQRKGLWWHQAKPFTLTLLLTENRMVQTVPGQAPQIITAENNPQLFQFNHLLMALFNADRAALEKNFTLNLQDKDSNGWILILTPKTMPFNKLFRQIRLTGADFLTRIEIDDMQNDKSSIRFFNHQTKPEQLTDEESSLFAS